MSLTVGELNATINLDNRGFNKGLDQSEQKFRGFGSSINSMASRIAPAAAAIGLSFGAVAAGIGALATKAVGLSANMEQSRIAFATMLGDAKKADAFIRQLQKFAAATPFEFVGLQENAKRLLAMGFAAKDIIPVLTNVGDAVAALGSGDAGLQNITYALGQMKTAGKVHTQDLMQLTNAGVGAWQMLADKLHVTVSKAQEMVQRGEVTSVQGLDAIMAGMHSRYGGLMAKQSQTVTGLFSNLQDIATQSLTKVGDMIVKTFDVKGKIAGLTNFITAISTAFDQGGFGGAFKAGLEQFIAPEAVEPALAKVGAAFDAIGSAFKRIGDVISGAMSGPLGQLLGPDGINVWENLDGVLVGVAAVVAGVLTAAFAALAISVLAATWPLLAIGAGVALVAVLAYELYTHWGQLMKVLEPFTSIVGPKLRELWNALQPSIKQIRDQLGPIGDEFKAAFKEWQPILEQVGGFILQLMGSSLGMFIDMLKFGIPIAVEATLKALKQIGFVVDAVAAAVRGDWTKALQDLKDAASVDVKPQAVGGISNLAATVTSHTGAASPGRGARLFDTGGIFRSQQFIGVAEKRTEVVAALDDLMPMIVAAVQQARGGGDIHLNMNNPTNPRALARELALEWR